MGGRGYFTVIYFLAVAGMLEWFLLAGAWSALNGSGRGAALFGLILLLIAPRWHQRRRQTPAMATESLAAEQQRSRQQWETAKNQLAEKERELRSKNVELRLINQRFQKLDRAKFEFVSVTTHQLRTPLAAIKWTFHMFLTGALGAVSEEQKEFLKQGYDGAERAINVLNEILNIDYVEAHKTDYQFAQVDLVELAENTVLGFQDQIRAHRLQLVLLKPPTRPPAVEADPRKLSIVLENLVDNALKYTNDGGQVTVEIDDSKLNSARSVLTISVADTGIGIPASEQDRIFQRFFRSTNAVRKVTDGNGLGLAIAKEIVDHHQGEIRFESREGRGTKFFITIPVRQTKV